MGEKYFGVTDYITFGKHSGKQLQEIIREDPWWLDWLFKQPAKPGYPERKLTREAENDLRQALITTPKPKKENAPKREYKPLASTDRMPFGKHSGKTIGYLIETEPHYLKYMIENNQNFRLTESAENQVIEATKRRKK